MVLHKGARGHLNFASTVLLHAAQAGMDVRDPATSRMWLDRILLAALTGAAAWASLQLARTPGGPAAVWAGNGILVGWLLAKPYRDWPQYLAIGSTVELVARIFAGGSPDYVLQLVLANVVEILIVSGTIRHAFPDLTRQDEWLRLAGLSTIATLLACAISGVIATRATVVLHGGDFAGIFIGWYAAHVLGMVLFATLVMVIRQERSELLYGHGRGWQFLASMLLLAVVSVGAFTAPYPVLFLAYPVLLMGAFRHHFAGVAIGMVLLTTVGSIATAFGRGPLWGVEDVDMHGRVALLQLYLAGGCLMTIPVAVATSMRTRLVRQLKDSEYRYRLLAEYSQDIIVRMRGDGVHLYVSPAAREILGWEPEELLVPRWESIHPDDCAGQKELLADIIRSGEPRLTTYRSRHKDGHYLWLEAILQAIPGPGEGDVEVVLTGRDVTRRVTAEKALEESHRELERLTRMDPLTGVANRRQLDASIDLALLRLKRNAVPVALMYLDLDRFKEINDSFGHAAGDEILRQFAGRVLRCVRGNDLVSRLGGDEFVVVIEDAKLPFAAEAIAAKLLEETDQPMFVDGHCHHVTASVGIGYAHTAVEACDLMRAADAALYEAKHAGRNTYRVHVVDGVAPGTVAGQTPAASG